MFFFFFSKYTRKFHRSGYILTLFYISTHGIVVSGLYEILNSNYWMHCVYDKEVLKQNSKHICLHKVTYDAEIHWSITSSEFIATSYEAITYFEGPKADLNPLWSLKHTGKMKNSVLLSCRLRIMMSWQVCSLLAAASSAHWICGAAETWLIEVWPSWSMAASKSWVEKKI